MTLEVVGEIVRDSDVLDDYEQACTVQARALHISPRHEWSKDRLASFLVPDLILTSCFVSIDPRRGRMFLNQSYSGLERLFPTRFRIEADRFSLRTEPVRLPGRYVVLGGPIDGVWYHWLFNWCPRLLLVRSLRPDLMTDPDVRFLVHPRALHEPFRSVLDTFGIPAERFVAVDPECDYRIERAHLVSFLDHVRLYPEQIRAFADHLLCAWNLADEPQTPGVFASRQALPPPKRRIHNFAEVEPILGEFGLRIVHCGALAPREQARVFRAARVVVGGHGSDLANILFCRPGTKVLVLESAFNIDSGRHLGLAYLCEVLHLDYHLMETETVENPGSNADQNSQFNRDFSVSTTKLLEILRKITRSESDTLLESIYGFMTEGWSRFTRPRR